MTLCGRLFNCEFRAITASHLPKNGIRHKRFIPLFLLLYVGHLQKRIPSVFQQSYGIHHHHSFSFAERVVPVRVFQLQYS